ncbi:ArsR/SmtB family transcription factor [Cellulomonas wangsupingiae]|uniref:Metalloregulator ArsR/SmtB family transcription factor n=1 Tax=Cellulomonas wangsupingiae TaxID=2968085 RepID=A0ABY5K2W7_9CELL|nr:metalloregulator ArsR/SmtB family transcription factor [Cellulomonas wangsupingiae]MCC2333582.1 metalloregulator ArsR/SmtB family transcription factor [Cellulomonas wangsupingiae]MCM0641511.1 metalloregulator ArsR/SmtB family transcription factor [Cellulomonas wangsupingiae]UUI63761.1 metalloregulator ArsR/SmtB family transcription factor [Cellulomonas wangsupingiae]
MNVFEAVVEPRRRQILDELRGGERVVSDLVDALGVAQPSVSQHLRTLRTAGLVDVRPEGRLRWYRLRPAPLAELDAWLLPYREAWADTFDALADHLDSLPADAPEEHP